MPRLLISSLIRKQEGNGIMDIIMDKVSPPEYKGEKHYPGYHFLGPGTNLEERRKDPTGKAMIPINQIDSVAKTHDLKFEQIGNKYKSGKLNKEQAKKEIWNADDEFIENLKKTNEGNLITKKLASRAIILKKLGEKLGVLPIEEFSLKGGSLFKNYFSADHMLRAEANKIKNKNQQNGGFIAPFLVPIIASLGGAILDKILAHYTDKNKTQKGGSLMDDEDKKKHIIVNILDKMKPAEQINFIHDTIFKK